MLSWGIFRGSRNLRGTLLPCLAFTCAQTLLLDCTQMYLVWWKGFVTSDIYQSLNSTVQLFEFRTLGLLFSLPGSPLCGPSLVLCMVRIRTHCNRSVHSVYTIVGPGDAQQILFGSIVSLWTSLSFASAFVTETLETLIRQAENYTSILFCNSYRNMALEAAASVQEFFTDVGLYLFGADVNPEEFVNRFFDSLFPLVYNHLINPAVTDSSLEYSECIRMARRDISPFGNIPQRVMGQMGRSLLPSRTFLQALNLGIEVINTTDHLLFSRECGRALLRMQYCPHCQGLTLSKPCMGYCLNVVRGCLAHMAELNPHWHAYIRSLEELSDAMHGTYDIEHVLLNFHLLVNDAVMQAHLDRQKLSEQVNKLCGHPMRSPTESPRCSFDGSKEKLRMKISTRNGEETLANRRKEFINSLRLHRTFYGGLADQLCVNDLAAADGLPCWNGEDIVKRYFMGSAFYGYLSESVEREKCAKGKSTCINLMIAHLYHGGRSRQAVGHPPRERMAEQLVAMIGMVEQVSGGGRSRWGAGCCHQGEPLEVTKNSLLPCGVVPTSAHTCC
ncbi:hypothetical protein QTO34_016747 [Cnephaeus nilssonii]|uniref:Glypican 5 n=1 Tax=Cnephaeus nilssonii TaxID=3371016 RepID=A0AA40I2W7_CNENI|nr:hypothetical protein QTO34_016747 [Eptesicus nilssonii]